MGAVNLSSFLSIIITSISIIIIINLIIIIIIIIISIIVIIITIIIIGKHGVRSSGVAYSRAGGGLPVAG